MKQILRHLFLPHHTNNQRAKVLHSTSIFLTALLIFAASFALSSFKNSNPSILGVSVNISSEDLLTLTNQERQKVDLVRLVYNNQLAVAAHNKAVDMFTDNYWAHISPTTGRTPWVFIQNAGYTYTYAGENLARGFTTSSDVINAWMASPTHRANVLSSNYQDVGFAIEQGTLTGEDNTVLIVEMFGGKLATPLENAKSSPPQQLGLRSVLAEGPKQIQSIAPAITTSPVVDKLSMAKLITQFLLILFIVIFVLDIILIERKKISRLVGHNIDHVLFLTAILLFIIFISSGRIF